MQNKILLTIYFQTWTMQNLNYKEMQQDLAVKQHRTPSLFQFLEILSALSFA